MITGEAAAGAATPGTQHRNTVTLSISIHLEVSLASTALSRRTGLEAPENRRHQAVATAKERLMSNKMTEQLEANPLRKALIHHPFFKEVRSSDLTRDKVGVFLGQWWHPLHYFPNFLSRTIDAVPVLEMKTAICKILNQELG
jgi:hypothetical protein